MTAGAKEQNHMLAKVMDSVRESTSIDLSSYKPSVVARAASGRMAECKLTNMHDYFQHLRTHPDEASHLVSSVMLSVTSFFRDPLEWRYLQEDIIPTLAEVARSHPIRVWCAGCSTGEEAYSLAITMAEVLGLEEFSRRVTILCSDIEQASLLKAERAVYPSRQLSRVPANLRTKYFVDRQHNMFEVTEHLRRSVSFIEHNIICEPPPGKFDLITCRNALIYLGASGQRQAMANFNEALEDDGFLFLGRYEEPDFEYFERVNHRQVFRKRQMVGPASQYFRPPKSSLLHRAFEHAPYPLLILDAEHILVYANRKARLQFGFRSAQCGTAVSALNSGFKNLPQKLIKSATDCAPLQAEVILELRQGPPAEVAVDIVPILLSEKRVVGFVLGIL